MTVEIRTLQRSDDRQAFRSGDDALDLFFHRYAGQNQFRHHIGATYVAVEAERILGFVTVSPGSLDAVDLPSGRRTPPYPVPILRVARLAVDQSAAGRGLGRGPSTVPHRVGGADEGRAGVRRPGGGCQSEDPVRF